MAGTKGLGSRIKAGFDRWKSRPITFGAIFGFLFTLFCFVVVAVAPVMRIEKLNWGSWASWKTAMGLAWAPLAAAIYLKFSEAAKRNRTLRTSTRRTQRYINLTIGEAIIELATRRDANEWDWLKLRPGREPILRCVVHTVRLELGITDDPGGIVASLLDFSTGTTDTMQVVARSTDDRKTPKEYESNRSIAWEAIKTACPAVVHDIQEDRRWRSVGERTYRSVLAVPITFDGKAFGAVAVDSKSAYAFYGKEKDLAVAIQPYIAVLALTYKPDAVSSECRYTPTHFPQ